MKTFKELQERLGGKGYKPYKSLTGKKVSGDWEDSDRGAGNKATRRAGGTVKAKSPTYIAHVVNKGKKKIDPKKNPVVEAKVEAGRSDYGKASVRNKRRFGKEGEPAVFDASGERGKMIDKRRAEHKAKRGVKEDYKGTADLSKADPAAKKKVEDRIAKHFGTKRVPGGKKGVKEEVDAYKYVVAKLKKKHGDGVLTKHDKRKPQSAADKAKARAHQAKVDAENAAERAKDPSQGRYPKG